MMRLPQFHYYRPRDVNEAARVLAGEDNAMVVAGGTDLLPNMKRRQQTPRTLVTLRHIDSLKGLTNGTGLTVGAGVTLTSLVENESIKSAYKGLWQAAAQVATPHLRNMGTLGGNVCLDTRCNYYDQNYEWRKAIDFCMKKDGEVCWVSTGSKKCLATSSTDTAPALISLRAEVELVSATGQRTVALRDLYRDDGIHYLTRKKDEILTNIILPDANGTRSTYWKLRRRGSFDFPVLAVAAAIEFDGSDTITAAQIVLGAAASQPVVCTTANEFLKGRRLTDAVMEEAAAACVKAAKPVKNTDYAPHWRKRISGRLAHYALQELRGDDMRATRIKIARQQF